MITRYRAARSLLLLLPLLATLCWSSISLAQTKVNPNQIQQSVVWNQINAQTLNGIYNAATFSGADIDAQVNAAYTACSSACTVYIPAGTYNSVTTTISFPVNNNGTASLWCDPGATINYTGTGDWLQAFGTGASGGQNTANVYIYGGCRVAGTSSGTAGIHTRIFQRGVIRDITISGFTNGDGIFNEGSNTLEIHGARLNSNKNGVHNVGIHSTNNFSANAIKMYGGVIQNNSQWGWFEDGSQSATTGPNQKNVISTTFETNGVNASSTSGNIFIQQCDSCEVNGSYLEYGGSVIPVSNIIVGDGTYSPSNTIITNNIFLSTTATNSILIQGSTTAVKVENNIEDGTATNFINRTSGVRLLNVGYNRAASVSNYVTGTDGGVDMFIYGSSGPSNTYLNGSGTTTRGYGFNGLAGLSNDLAVRTRSGGTNSMVWQVGSSGATAASMSDAGLLTDTGSVSSGTNSVSGCSLTSATGGATAGKFASGTSGTCTVTITLPTAPNGWTCDAHDTTTVADVINQTSFLAGSAVISGTTVSGDVITWKCQGW